MKIGGSNKDRLKGLEKFFQTKQEKIIPLSLEKKVAPPLKLSTTESIIITIINNKLLPN